jgi:hypothetical protein
VDDAAGQSFGPRLLEMRELAARPLGEPRRDRVGLPLGGREQRRPARERERVRPRHGEIAAGLVQPRQRAAESLAMAGVRAADRDAGQEGDDRGRPPGEPPERAALPVVHRLRAGEAAGRQMVHESEEER